jgi:hypothetical protein
LGAQTFSVLIPAVPSPINPTRNTSALAPISAEVRRAITVAVAGITVRPIVAGIRRVGVARVTSIVGYVARIVGWVTAVGWVTSVTWPRADVDGHALGGCFERHKYRHAQSNSAHKYGR